MLCCLLAVFLIDTSVSLCIDEGSLPQGQQQQQQSSSTKRPVAPLPPTGRLQPDGKLTPLGNGGVGRCGRYYWTQTLGELTVYIDVPGGTRGKDVSCSIGCRDISVGVAVVSLSQTSSSSPPSLSLFLLFLFLILLLIARRGLRLCWLCCLVVWRSLCNQQRACGPCPQTQRAAR